uniref:Lipoxygenase domain-containing protein n=1 Tax=Ciona savignyi TaxID=51511 RepID=H2YSA1_CIOSA
LFCFQTGSMKFAGTDSNVFIAMTGASGEKTSLTKLDNSFHDDFERGSVDKFKVKLEDIGQPVILTIKHEEAGMFADWYVTSATVQKSGESKIHRFPVNMWVTGTVDVAIGTAKLFHQEENPILLTHRRRELELKKRDIRWRSPEIEDAKGLPGYIFGDSLEDLPRNMRLEETMLKDFEETKKLGKNNILDKFQEVVDKWDQFADFKNVFLHPKMPKVPDFQQNWERDEEFGRQLLNGCHPTVLKKCTELPKKFPVTNKMASSQLTRGVSLEQEIKASKIPITNGYVYIIDLEVLEGMPCGRSPVNQSAYFGCAPMCLLYLNCKKNLVPIAIQLWQQPGVNNPIWTPDDSDCDWMLAKIYFRNAEANVQLILEKLLRTHFVLEPFSLAAHRCLSQSHPLLKLLLPHLRFACAGSLVARTLLINAGGAMDKLLSFGGGSQKHILREACKSFKYEDLNIRKLLAKNGTHDRSKLPGYYFREDAFLFWDCLVKYVTKVARTFYKSNEDVTKDDEIQNCLREIRTEGFGWENGKDTFGLPEQITSIEELVEFASCIIFTATFRNAGVSNGLFDICMNVPNAPLNMALPPPTEKGKGTHEMILQSLPTKASSCMQVTLCHALSKHGEEEVYMADYPVDIFCEEPAQRAAVHFRDELQRMSTLVRSRNEGSNIPYEYLLPERVPLAISI